MNTQSIGLISICILLATIAPTCGASEAETTETSQVELIDSFPGLNESRTIGGTEPLSSACKQFPYTRYFRVDTYEDFTYFGQNAKAGDMIELVAGIYYLRDGEIDRTLPNPGARATDSEGPTAAKYGIINGRIGTFEKPIVFCGAENKTIIDGADSVKYAHSGVRILNSRHIYFTGFIIRNVLKGKEAIFKYFMVLQAVLAAMAVAKSHTFFPFNLSLLPHPFPLLSTGVDLQRSKYSDISYISTRNTLQEGIRIRYNSTHNTVRECTIKYTGLMYKGVGEGIYIGTSVKNSIRYGLPRDNSHYNIIINNKIGPGVTAEGIDIKEFTAFGEVVNNRFDGKDLSGVNGAISWIAVKGNRWNIQGNEGENLKKKGFVGIKVVQVLAYQGNRNVIQDNQCNLKQGGSLCVFIAQKTRGNTIACSNSAKPSSRKSYPQEMCNCKSRCLSRSGRTATLGETPVLSTYYDADALFDVEEEAARPSWD